MTEIHLLQTQTETCGFLLQSLQRTRRHKNQPVKTSSVKKKTLFKYQLFMLMYTKGLRTLSHSLEWESLSRDSSFSSLEGDCKSSQRASRPLLVPRFITALVLNVSC